MAERTITTTAVGRTSAQPDEVVLTFSARDIDPDVTDARRAVAEQAAHLRQVLDDAGVPGDRVRTSRFQVRKRPPNRGDGSKHDAHPFEATERVEVILHDMTRLGDVLSAAVDEAGVEIDEVAFTFRPETRRTLQREAIADAVDEARKKAAAAAEVEGLTVDGVRSIVTDEQNRIRRTSAAMRSGATAESGSVESGPIDVAVRVEVEYCLSDS